MKNFMALHELIAGKKSLVVLYLYIYSATAGTGASVDEFLNMYICCHLKL